MKVHAEGAKAPDELVGVAKGVQEKSVTEVGRPSGSSNEAQKWPTGPLEAMVWMVDYTLRLIEGYLGADDTKLKDAGNTKLNDVSVSKD